LSRFATMGHCGFITVHGRELRVFRKIQIFRRSTADLNGRFFTRESLFLVFFPSEVLHSLLESSGKFQLDVVLPREEVPSAMGDFPKWTAI
jgi:hypothetical protein